MSVAVRFPGPSPNIRAAVEGLLGEWIADQEKRGIDLGRDLERLPYVEPWGEGAAVIFDGRPGNSLWKDWMVSLTSWVNSRGYMHLAIVDRVGGGVRPVTLPRGDDNSK